MKTKIKHRCNRIKILLSLTAIILLSFNSKAQLYVDASGNVGVGISSPANKFHVVSTTEQQRLAYDASKYLKTTVTSTGATKIEGIGTPSVTVIGGDQATSQLILQGSSNAASTLTDNAVKILVGDNNGNKNGMVMLFNGATSIGGNPASSSTLRLTRKIEGNVTSRSLFSDAEIQSDVTTACRMFESAPSTKATSFTLASLHHFIVTDVSIGSGSTVTTQNGFLVGDMSSATNNRGFSGGLTSGTNKYNCYMSGDAKNYFAGNTGIGTTSPANKLDVEGGLAVGATYSGTSAAPTNGAIIEGNVAIGATTVTTGFKLDVQNGGAGTKTINASGDIWAGGAYIGSDKMFKTDIDSLQNALATIKQLKPKSYYFDTLNFNGKGKFSFSSAKQYGFIANEVQTILPELVSFAVKPAIVDSSGNEIKPAYTYRGLNYIAIIPFLTKGIQELSNQNDSLQTKTNKQDSINALLQSDVNKLKLKTNNQDSIANQLITNNSSLQNQVNQLIEDNASFQNQLNQLMETINNCCSSSMQMPTENNPQAKSLSGGATTQTDVTLNDMQTIVLEQNVPNPFAEQTAISYFLPDNTVKAQIMFYNTQGNLIQTVALTQKGKGILNVFASDLSNGTYSYLLIVDGQVIETKKMVKAN